MTIAISSDHAGFAQLKKLKDYLENELGHSCHNFGPAEIKPDDDYPDFILPAARAVAGGQCEMGIILGGSGQGEAMVANRVRGVRCAVYYGPATAAGSLGADGSPPLDGYDILRLSRQHNSANMLSLAARFLSVEQMQIAVRLWLATPFSHDSRHQRRVAKLDDIS